MVVVIRDVTEVVVRLQPLHLLRYFRGTYSNVPSASGTCMCFQRAGHVLF